LNKVLKREVFYISNLISFSRFILLAVTAIFLVRNDYLPAIIFIIISAVSDLLDGYFARNRNEISELGKIIDPLADKITIAVVMFILLLQGVVPLWFFIITLFRDFIIFTGGLYLKYKKNIVLQSNRTGKMAAFSIGLTLLIFMAVKWLNFSFPAYHTEFVELLSRIFILISIVMAGISLLTYAKRFKDVIK
jgi:CDP-diacylglycerol--glycerol-3-phosphate 3-phosphatidyltransferase